MHFNAASQSYQSFITASNGQSSTAGGDLATLAGNQVYWFKLKSEDISYPFTWRLKAQSNVSVNPENNYVRLLKAGWNQTSLPLDAAITNDGDIERYIKGTSIERIWYYQQSQDRWYAYYKNRADQSTLTELKPDAVYWVLSNREQILTADDGNQSSGTSSKISSQKAYLHNNHLGSVAFETDESGAVSQASLYQPYGANLKDSKKASEKVSTYSFSGKEEDGSGLYYFEARYYDPVTTRFVSPDPLFAVDMEKCIESIIECNLYQYTGNNPVNFVDPSGLASGDLRSYPDAKLSVTETVNAVADFTPVLSNAKAAQEVATGENLITGEPLSPVERGIAAAAIVGGPAARLAGKVGLKVKSAVKLNDGDALSTNDALDAALDHLGDGYKQVAEGVFKSADGTKLLRMTDSDLAKVNNHGGAPHMNFETGKTIIKPNGKESFVTNSGPEGNKHIYLPEEK